MNKFGIGQPVKRFEDRRLLSGKGRFINDVNLAGQAYAVVVRSPHSHARMVSVDAGEARAAPGVLAVFTGEDVAADGLGTMAPTVQRKRPDGGPMFARSHPGLAIGWVRYVGDPFALVIAESLMQAKDAAELIAVEYDDLPSVTDTAQAAKGETAVWAECPDNISNIFESGDRAATEAAFANADHVVSMTFDIGRVTGVPLEPRAALGAFDAASGRYTLYAGSGGVVRQKREIAAVLNTDPSNVRVLAFD
ncbi:MAG: molybdopterin-dependent oxidoreductase, partial [Alphaproteobacteria bacterium]|nr:molybdopterin-dependent oxidoreductase [Alphaproteobacteria bacterium]